MQKCDYSDEHCAITVIAINKQCCQQRIAKHEMASRHPIDKAHE